MKETRQALALMDHPNIAKVLDAGSTDTGRPFFVMELVKGVPITRFCDERHLSPRQRLDLFVPVCQAIQHAHQKGIIHRDIKPTNVLVALYDDRPVPKVIDFGVAKAAGFQLTDASLVTGFGAVVGTPEYMSPEQAQLNQLDIDTRSDVYGLGVLLYELLTGTTPIDRKRLAKAALLEILRLIREEEPPRPSTRLSTSDALPSIAAARQTEPAKLTRLVRGELDWIVMKCLEKDRARRYETANALAHDIQRYLADEQVEACPPSSGYRLRKLVRRHRTGVAISVAVASVLLATAVITSWQAFRATRAERAALQARDAEAAARNRAEESALAEAKAKALAQASEENLEREMSLGIVGSMETNDDAILNELEVEALWRLARTANERVRLRFLEEAMRTDATANRLRTRSAWFVHGAVGLDPQRRIWATRLLTAGMRDPAKSVPQRTSIAWAALEFFERGSPLQRECAGIINEGWAAEKNEDYWGRFSLLSGTDRLLPADAAPLLMLRFPRHPNLVALSFARGLYLDDRDLLWQAAGQLESLDAARLCAEANRLLSQALAQENCDLNPSALAEGLAAAANRLEPAEAARACTQAALLLTQALSSGKPNVTNSGRGGSDPAEPYLAVGLAAVTSQMEPGEAARLLKQALSLVRDPSARKLLAARLATVANGLEPGDAFPLLRQGLILERDSSARLELARGFAAAAERVGARVAAAKCTETARFLNEALAELKDGEDPGGLAEALAVVAGTLEPNDAARVCGEASRLLIQLRTKTKSDLRRGQAAVALTAVAGRLDPVDRDRLGADAAQSLTRALDGDQEKDVRLHLAGYLAEVTRRLKADEASRILDQVLAHEKDPNVRPTIRGLSPVV